MSLTFEERRKKFLEENDPYGVAGLTTGEAVKYAIKMGSSDSLRGINQLLSQGFNNEEELERLAEADRKLYKIMQHPEFGTEAATAFFTAAIGADPLSYVPFAGWLKKGKSAKNFSDFAKYGATTGAAVSFLGYTPEDYALFLDDDASFVAKKFEQTGLGATVGGLLSTVGAKGTDMYMKARHGKSIFQNNTPTRRVDDASDVTVDTTKVGDYRVGQKVFLKDKKNQGVITSIDEAAGIAEVRISNAKTGKSVRKEFYINEFSELKPTPKKGKPALIDTFLTHKGKGRQGRVWTIFDSVRSRAAKGYEKDISYQITKSKDGYTVTRNIVQKNSDPDLPSAPFTQSDRLETFNTLRQAKNFAVKQISPNAKGAPKMSRAKVQERLERNVVNLNSKDENPSRLSLASIWDRVGGEDITELLWHKIKLSPVETGGAFAGAYVGFQNVDTEDSMSEYFGTIMASAIGGAAGVKGIKAIDNKYNSGKYQEWLGFQTISDFGLTDSYKVGKVNYVKNKNQIASDFYDVLVKAEKTLSPEENKLLYIFMSGDPADFSKLSKEALEVGDEARALISKYAQDLVDLGLLNEKTFKKNIDIYMRRVYSKPGEDGQAYSNRITLGKNIKTIANNLKPRGHKPKEVTPARFKNKWSKEGWYLDGKLPNGKYRIRKDYTKQERLDMGEMEDFSKSLSETGRLLSNDISAVKFFDDVAKKFSISAQEFKAGKLRDGTEIDKNLYREIPDVNIRGTAGIKKYGELSGRYVDKYVHNDIVHTFQLTKQADDGIGKQALNIYDSLLGLWKKTKTAWNLGTHVANTMSNVILIDFAGTSHTYLAKAARSMYNNDKNFKDAVIHGGMGADLLSNDIRRFGVGNENMFFQKLNQMSDNKNPITNVGDALTRMWKSKFNIGRLTLDGLEKAYQLEDQIFRHAVYLDRLDKGFTKAEAAADARKWFIDYDINAPFIQQLKRTALPFVSYTYRVAPLLVEGSIRRPTALAAWSAIGYGMNQLGIFATEDETGEQLDRLTMREKDNKTMWNIPGMPPTTVRLPYNNSQTGDAMYVDITRWMPGGDLFLERQGEGLNIKFLPQPLQPGGPVVDLAYMFASGDDPFTGQEIDTDRDTVEILKHFLSHQLPNMPGVPGSFATERMNRIMKQNPPDPDTFAADYVAPILGFHTKESLEEQGSGYDDYRTSEYAVPYGFWEGMAYTLGIKLKPMDSSINYKQQVFEFEQEKRELGTKRNKIIKDYQSGSDLPEEYKKKYNEFELEEIEFYARYNKFVNSVYALQLKMSYEEGQKANKEANEEIMNRLEQEGIETPRLKKFDGGGVNVPYTKDAPRDRVDKFTGRPYSEQMNNLGFDNE